MHMHEDRVVSQLKIGPALISGTTLRMKIKSIKKVLKNVLLNVLVYKNIYKIVRKL